MRESSNPVFRNMDKISKDKHYPTVIDINPAESIRYGQPEGATRSTGYPIVGSRPVTIDDIVTKTFMSLGLLSIVAVFSYILVDNNSSLANPLIFIGGLGALVVVISSIFSRKYGSPLVTLSYAVLEGLVVGSVSNLVAKYVSFSSGIIFEALLATLGVVFGMLVVYRFGIIRVTPRLFKMVFAATFGALIAVLADWIVGFFHAGGLGFRSNGALGIIFSLLMIGIAAFNLLIDFDQADKLVRSGAPEESAWGVALGLMVTIVWIYIEVIRLLSILNSDS